MICANVVFPLLVLGFAVCVYFGYALSNSWLYYFGNYGWLALLMLFTLTWGWTLFRLY